MKSAPIPWRTVEYLLARGVPVAMAARMVNLRLVEGGFIAFYEEVDGDLILWNPETGEIDTFAGRAFCLGSDNLTVGAGVFAHLRIEASPLDWLVNGARGVFIVDWAQAFDRLRDVPQVAVAEAVLPLYRRAIRPSVPDLAVLASDRRAAA